MVSIILPAYKQLELTKTCISYVLKNTQDIPYELICVGSGTTIHKLENYRDLFYRNKIIYENKWKGK